MSPYYTRLIARGQRLMGPWPEKWNAIGKEVRDVEGRAICITPEYALAELIATLHNTFLPLLNYTVMLNRNYADLIREKGIPNDNDL